MSTLSAGEARRTTDGVREQNPKRTEIMQDIKSVAEKGGTFIRIPFDKIGYQHDDVDWLEKLGYDVDRNSACLWWTISW